MRCKRTVRRPTRWTPDDRRSDLPKKTLKNEAPPSILPQNGYIKGRLFRDIIHSKYGGDDAQD